MGILQAIDELILDYVWTYGCEPTIDDGIQFRMADEILTRDGTSLDRRVQATLRGRRTLLELAQRS
jgi:hypothetical protein